MIVKCSIRFSNATFHDRRRDSRSEHVNRSGLVSIQLYY
jgi:hypothetical protein